MLPIIMLIVGIIGLVKGTISVTRTKEIRRPASIFISLIFMAPLPLSFIAGIILGATAVANANGGQPNLKDLESTANIIGLVITFGCFLVALILSFALAKPKQVVARKRDQEDDYDDKPRRKKEYDDDEDDDRPRRRPSRDDD